MPYGPGCWDTTQPHQVTPKLEEWLIHWRAGFPFRRTSRNWRNKLAGTSWGSTNANASGSEVPHAPCQAEGWANSPAAGVWGLQNSYCQPGETPEKGVSKTVRGAEYLMYKERLGQLVCLAWRWEGQEGISLQSSTILIHWRRQTQTFLRDAQQKNKRQQSQAATREILIGNMEKNHLSESSASPRQGPKRTVQSPPLEIFKPCQGLEQPELILKVALLQAEGWTTDLHMFLST